MNARRMRKYVHRNLINSMKPHSFEDLILVRTCQAFQVLPEDIGVTR